MLLQPVSERLLPVRSSSMLWFQVSHLGLKPISEFIFLSSFILLHVAVHFSQHHLLKRLLFPHWIFFPASSRINWPYSYGFRSRFSVLFHWSIYLFLCQYHTVWIMIAVYYNLKSAIVIPPICFSFSILLWLFEVFSGSIQLLGLFVLVLWEMSLVF